VELGVSRLSEEVGKKKVVGRDVATVLGIICIVLAVGLVGAVADYASIISGKDDTIASLNSQIAEKDDTISYMHSDMDTQYSQISSLLLQVGDLGNIVNLTTSTVWISHETISQPAASYTHWTFSASYAGYVSVWVLTSINTTNVYIRVIYAAYGVNFNQQIDVGASGTAVFPILPSSSIEIRVSNSNLINGATETVRITYYY